MSDEHGPQTLWVRTTTGPGAPVAFDADQVAIGGDAQFAVVVPDPASAGHAVLARREAGTWWAAPLGASAMYVGGQPMARIPLGPSAVRIALGRPDATPVDLWSGAAPGPSGPPAWQPGPHTGALTIGRDDANDLVVTDPLVSRFHARIEPGQQTGGHANQPAVLVDLGSFNGTFVDGHQVQGRVLLRLGAEIVLGNRTFSWDGRQLQPVATATDYTLHAAALTTVLKDGRRLMQDVSLTLEPATLTAVIGPSGAGKSTLLGALTGLRPATSGRVVWQGRDLYASYEQLRHQIGLVPQQDIQHRQLKVRQALKYAAELRLPPDTTAPERADRVAVVAGQLQLTQRMDNRIGTQLSGGQRKRVSIATELLTAPPLLFLDEPTSGLDPGLDVEVMRQLRTLADDGRIVVVVTHSVLALDICDDVLVLAPGGRVAYLGPPAGVLAHFGVATYPEVFDLLDEPDRWQRIPPVAPAPPPPAALEVPPDRAPGMTAAPTRRVEVRRQLSTLVRRNVAVLAADRLLLTMLLVMPIVLGGLSRVVPGHAGLSLLRAPTAPGGLLGVQEASQRIILLIVAAALMGTAMTIRELISERPIFQREYAVGLSPDVYLLSKILVLATAGFGQGLLVTAIATVGLPGPDFGGSVGGGRVEVALAIGALTFTMAVVGLALSSVVTSTEQAMPALAGIIMVQLVLSGSIIAMAGRPVLAQLAWLSPARWTFAALSSTVSLQRPKRQLHDRHLDWIALHGAHHWLMDVAMIALLCLVAAGLAVLGVRRSSQEA